MSTWQAVIFDLDDTLYPEHDYVLSGFRAVAAWAEKHIGIPMDEGFRELHAMYTQGVRGHTFDLWLGSRAVDKALAGPLIEVYRAHAPALTFFPEATAALRSLRDRYRLGLVTDGDAQMQRRKLEALEAEQYFDAIVLSDEIGRHAWKPSPLPFAAVLEHLGSITPDHGIYVGDNPTKDFIGARAAGLAAIRILRPGGEYSDLHPVNEEYEPDLTISSLADLDMLLLRQHPGSLRRDASSGSEPFADVH